MKRFIHPLSAIPAIAALMIILAGCTADHDERQLIFHGNIRDDILITGITGGGRIKVDAFSSTLNGTFFSDSWRNDRGSATIQPNGDFSVRFTEWTEATSYFFTFEFPSEQYIIRGTPYLNDLEIAEGNFSGGQYSTQILAAPIRKLEIDFHNQFPFDNNDELQIRFPDPSNILFGYLIPEFTNLQNCSKVFPHIIKGGNNASGIFTGNVPADRKIRIERKTIKNGVSLMHADSVFINRNGLTHYSLNY